MLREAGVAKASRALQKRGPPRREVLGPKGHELCDHQELGRTKMRK